jgi:hypothetical protein
MFVMWRKDPVKDMSNPPNDAYAVLKGGGVRHVGKFRLITIENVHDVFSSGIEAIYSPIHNIVIVIFESPPTFTVRSPHVTISIILLDSSVLGNRRIPRQRACQSQDHVLANLQRKYLKVIV